MNLLFYISMFLFNPADSNSFYDLQFEKLDGSIVKSSAFQGKKVVVAVISASQASSGIVRYLDSLQKSSPALAIIAVPTDEFNGNIKGTDLASLKESIAITIARPVKVKKKTSSQDPLFAWLTQNKANSHFDMDVEGEGQLFMINEKGTLYGVFPAITPRSVLDKAIVQELK